MQIGGTLHVSTDNQKEYINLGLYIGVSGQQIDNNILKSEDGFLLDSFK